MVCFRSDGDLNPGYRYQYTSLAGKRLRPLGHRSFYFLPHCAVGYGWKSSGLLNPTTPMQTRTDGEGFEPPEACTSTVFKTAAFDHSATLPRFISMFKEQSGAMIVKICKKSIKISLFLSDGLRFRQTALIFMQF